MVYIVFGVCSCEPSVEETKAKERKAELTYGANVECAAIVFCSSGSTNRVVCFSKACFDKHRNSLNTVKCPFLALNFTAGETGPVHNLKGVRCRS